MSDLPSKVAALEQIAKSVDSTLKDLKDDVRELRRDARTDFRLLFGATIATTLGLAALLAKGFKWF